MEKTVLVAGATGYVGGRLVPMLLQKGYRVKAFARRPEKVRSRPWGGHENLETVHGDMLDGESVRKAVKGCDAIYYLVHSMEARRDFCDADRHAAYNLVKALKGRANCRLIYLSGLLPEEAHVSAHLRSRAEVAEILSLADAPVTTLRAAQLIGAGSASFEMIRWLVDRLPVMITPKWTHVHTQPISIADALGYLTGVLEHPETAGQTYDIGGPDILSYEELFALYAEAAGLRKRVLIPVPWMTLGLSAAIISLVTPIPGALARPLIEGMRNEVVCRENRIRDIVPIPLTPISVAIGRALEDLREQSVQTCWFDAGFPTVPEWVLCGDPGYASAAVRRDAYSIALEADVDAVWEMIARIGGANGWYSVNILWRLRGVMDKIVGGPGIQRGRRSHEQLYVGDGLDFWRVLDIQPGKRLLLFTEMRMPGEGLLDFRVTPGRFGPAKVPGTELRLVLYFQPRGLLGHMYWHAVAPFHRLVFMAMLRAIAERTGRPVLRGPERVKQPGNAGEADAPDAGTKDRT